LIYRNTLGADFLAPIVAGKRISFHTVGDYGHAHIYQRFPRNADGRQIPYIVTGSGGHDARVPPGEKTGEAPRSWNDYTLLVGPTAPTAPGVSSAADRVTVQLSRWQITSHLPAVSGRASATPSAGQCSIRAHRSR
jgi:hypothetical protein